ncbi:hypothetical protein Nepgr_024225 [Nepenthes gracilis]|uniref:C2H2-type domain-containing protein n=1 Tax=Nepenthes gracilis TaxID=150966 RepID=A0AAD3T5I4_NEPGR|nr:hypothetical protein Nepgr_024225 [Nepenthes gracilis]
MEKHRCKLCFRRFTNGRALGGHVRSHMMNLPINPRKGPRSEPPPPISTQLEEDGNTDSAKSSASSPASSSSSSSEEEEEGKGLSYDLRENPKRSVRLVDPEFSSVAVVGPSSLVLQDGESEAESYKNPTRRRSKRYRKSIVNGHQIKVNEEAEPVSSISEVTPEEDVAFSLMMLSRDKWTVYENDKKHRRDEDSDSEELAIFPKASRNHRNFKCETCEKVFESYQALGGHRASHKKIRVANEFDGRSASMADGRKIHECPVCFRVFASGQALGGHKRSHVIGIEARTDQIKLLPKSTNHSLIDLNLPAPVDDDELTHSAVSDAIL